MKTKLYTVFIVLMWTAQNAFSQDTQATAVNLGTKSASFEYADTKNTLNYSNAYVGRSTNDVFYKFTLTTAMDVVINHCGSEVSDTYLWLLDGTGTRITYNDDYSSTGCCTNHYQSYIKRSLAAGTYYVVSEGYSSNGNITTSITGICPLPASGLYNGNAASSDQNYILTVTPTIATSNVSTLGTTQSLQTIQYFDGLGRPTETVQRAITPSGKDLVSTLVYDEVGREKQQWLPVPSVNSNGSFMNVKSFQPIQKTYYEDANPYAETVYEPSPLNRVTEQFGAGSAWQTAGKSVNTEYGTNSSEVKYFYVDASNQLIYNSTYPANTLYKTTVKDEDGKPTVEYKDKLGRVVMQRNGSDVDTYYVYNDLGQLSYVLPALAADASGSTGFTDAVNKYGYVYKYDNRGNCIYKKLPGCTPIYMVYDKADRLILSQDGNQRKRFSGTNLQWTVTKYDIFGRVIFTGLMYRSEKDSLNQYKTIRDLYANDLIVETCTNGVYSTNKFSGATPLTVNYYDNYDFIPSGSLLQYIEKQGYSTRFAPPSGGWGATGLLTGTRTYLLDGSDNYITSVNYYDDKGRIVQTRSTNHLGGYDMVYNDLDFTGKPNKTLKEHNISGQSTVSELYEYEYDHAGRLLDTYYKINSKDEILLAHNTYDELGRLQTKKRHNSTDIESFQYNIRNWTTKITSGTYQEQLFYNTLPSGAIGTPCYNGNISYTVTGNTSSMPMRSYSYTYDEFHRLKRGNAYYYTTSPSTFEGHFEDFTYDKMGNIKYLLRSKTGNSLIDFLSFTYNGNQVTAISDSQGSQNQYSVKEYQNKSNTTNEMTYDANGNMTKDLDRDIVTIQYNLLNLPEYVQFKNGNVIKNLYNAGGQKLKSDYYTRLTAITPLADGAVLNPVYNSTDYSYTGTAYVDNNEYSISKTYNSSSGNYTDSYTYGKAYNPEGYVTTLSNPQYYYFRKDHLGNNREVWLANTGATVQRTQYYPSGLPWAESTGQSVQNKKYNGKEFVEAHGLDEYDSAARWYYSAVMRTTTLDPLAEKYYSISPYAWCGNNPVRNIDTNGMDWYSYEEKYKDKEGKEQTRTAYKYVKGEMSEKEMKEGGFTHLGKTYDNGKGTYFSLGGSEIKYDEKNPISTNAVNRLKSADNTIIATVNAYEGVSKKVGDFWSKYNAFISSGSSAATLVSNFMELSKGVTRSINAFGYFNTFISAKNDYNDYLNGTLKGEKLFDAAINIVSLAGTPGAAISLSYHTVVKPGAKAIIKTETMLRTYIPNLIINANNGYWPY